MASSIHPNLFLCDELIILKCSAGIKPFWDSSYNSEKIIFFSLEIDKLKTIIKMKIVITIKTNPIHAVDSKLINEFHAEWIMMATTRPVMAHKTFQILFLNFA